MYLYKIDNRDQTVAKPKRQSKAFIPDGNGQTRIKRSTPHKSGLSTPKVYEPRIPNLPGRNETIINKVHRPDELQENIPGPALLAYLANVSRFGANYADSRIGMQQVRGADNLTQAGRNKWRAAHVCRCGSLLAVNGTCMASCE